MQSEDNTQTNHAEHAADTAPLAVLGEQFDLDFAAMLKPISPEQLCGPDARNSATSPADVSAAYRQLKAERAAARSLERTASFDEQAPGLAPGAQTHWQNILAQAPAYLTRHSKDLEVVAWVLEALLRLHGIAGLSAGFQLAANMVSDFQTQLHPQPDEDGIETQVAPLSGLNGDGTEGTLIRPLRLVPLTEVGGQSQGFSYSDYQIAAEIDNTSDPERREQRQAQALFTLRDIRQASATSSDDFCRGLQADLSAALDGLSQLSDALYAVFGGESPPTSLIKNTLLAVQQVVSDLLQGRVLSVDTAATAVAVTTETERSTGLEFSPRSNAEAVTVVNQQLKPDEVCQLNRDGAIGPITSREVALTQLTQIAEYFRASEPHSPMAGVLDRAIRWGRMPIEQLILELLPEDSARQIFAQLTGIGAHAEAGVTAAPMARPIAPSPMQPGAAASTAASPLNPFDTSFSQSQTNSEGVW